MTDVRVLVGPGVIADPTLLSEIAEREFAALGVTGALVHDELRSLDAGGAVVALPGPAPASRALMAREPCVWLDLDLAGECDLAQGAAHIHGRGVEGLAWAIRHAVHRTRHPARRIPYGAHRDQWGELYLPEREGPVPVVVLLHGGYWRSMWAADLMDALAADLAARGFAVWNLEYRRADRHGWAATTEDVAAGLDALHHLDIAAPDLAAPDLNRVAVAGHSAGAQLGLRAAADGARVRLAVSLAGVLDLVEAGRRWMSAGAVPAALTGTGECGHSLPGVYGEASPCSGCR